MKISEYLEIFRHQSYPGLFSSECLDALKNIQQSGYGEIDTSQAIYEINLSESDLTADVSFYVYDDVLKKHWLEFDFKNYSSSEKLQPCIFLEPEVFGNQEVLGSVFGLDKWERFRTSIDALKVLLGNKKIRLDQLGAMNGRGENFSESIRVVARARTASKTIELFKALPHDGDISLFENTVLELEPFAKKEIFGFDFELFSDGRISERTGAAFFARTSLKDARDLINFLVKNNFCSPTQAEEIIKWRSDELPDGIYVQEICHVKFQFEKDKIVAIKIYLRQSYPELFSAESLDALKNIQDKYGQLVSSRVLYEVILNKPVLNADFSCRLYDEILKNYWFEFDFDNYFSGENIIPCVFMETAPLNNHEVLTKLLGNEKFTNLIQPLNNFADFLRSKGTRLFNIGTLDSRRESSESLRAETRVKTCGRIIELLKALEYDGDLALIENTLSELESYAFNQIFTLSFDIFHEKKLRISDKIGVYFIPLSSLKDTRCLMKFLADNGFCLPEKASEIIRWKRDPLPEKISVQDIHHIKFQFMKNEIISVKTYLQQAETFQFFWR